jgi:flagellar basal body P-ring formation protein FlgA
VSFRVLRSAVVGLATVVGVLFPTVDARAALVRIRSEARLTRPLIRLGDIAEVAAETPAEQARLEGLAIAPAPAAGRAIRLEFADVRSRLEALGVDLSGTEFTGASTTIVTTPEAAPVPTKPRQPAPKVDVPQIIPPKAPAPKPAVRKEPAPKAPAPIPVPKPSPPVTDQQARRLEEVFAKEVLRKLASQSPPVREVDVAVVLDRANLDSLASMATSLITGTGSILVASTTTEQTPPGDETPETPEFEFHCRSPKGETCAVRPVCRLTPWPRVVQLKGTVPRGAVLRAEDLVERPVSPDRHDPETHPTGTQELIGRETTRVLRGGETIRRGDVREVPLVRRGELVTVHSRRAGITVRMEARSMDEGSVGQSVTVVALDGKNKYVTRVVGYHEVEVGGTATPVQREVASKPVNTPPAN